MHQITDIIGKPVLSVETGDRLGTVSDVLLEESTVKVVAVAIGGGLLAKEHVLPFRDVKTFGGDTVLARTEAGIVEPAQWRESGVTATRFSALRGRSVVTAGGHRLGSVSDLLIDETGVFTGLEVARHDLGGLRTRRTVVRASEEIRIGPDVIVVPDSAPDDDNSVAGSKATPEHA
jgi:uncharacterized protein YrrD